MVSNQNDPSHLLFEPITGVKDRARHFVQAHVRPELLMQDFEQVCLHAQAWHQVLPCIERIDIALDASFFEQADGVALLERQMVRTGTDPRSIGIIVNHAQLLSESERVSQALRKCKGLGLSITLDGLDVGHIHPTYLRSMPIDAVRICSASM